MPTGLERHHRSGYPHFITCSCFRHMPFLGASSERDLFLELLRHTTKKYQGELFAFVIMPDHFHLILGEPERGTIATILQVVKQRFSRVIRQHRHELLHGLTRRAGATDLISIWEARYYDYLIPNPDKFQEKLTYIHLNPVRRGLVTRMEDWAWSSCREYLERSARTYKDKDGADAPSPRPLAAPKNGATKI